jgi:hypothetical protein
MKKSILFATIATIYMIQVAYSAKNRNNANNPDPTERTLCEPNQYVKLAGGGDKSCGACGAGASRCYEKDDKSVVIKSCVRGKYLKAGKCEDCGAYCDVCKGPTMDECEKPKAGYARIISPKTNRV